MLHQNNQPLATATTNSIYDGLIHSGKCQSKYTNISLNKCTNISQETVKYLLKYHPHVPIRRRSG